MTTLLKAMVQLSGRMSKSEFLLRNSWRQLSTPPVKEVMIPTDWGHLAGRWWGSQQRQPLLALHGWQDNAGSWDALVPHLPQDCSVLAIDLPGHGKSSWIPKGLHYTELLSVQCIRGIMEHYKWDKVNLLGHSMGSIVAFTYASLYPDTVNFYIAVENLIPDIESNVDYLLIYKRFAKSLEKISIAQKRLDTEPPSYPYEEAVMRWHMGTKKSVSLESAHCLVDRGTSKSKTDPTKYYFCRDPRLKYHPHVMIASEYIQHGIRQLKFPVLYIKGADSKYAMDELAISCRELLAQTNDKYEFHVIPGTHHVHLNNAESVGPVVTQFLHKYSPVSNIINKSKI